MKVFVIVNLCQEGLNVHLLIPYVLDLTSRGPPANYVPAAAVIRRGQALLGFIGRKANVGGLVSQV